MIIKLIIEYSVERGGDSSAEYRLSRLRRHRSIQKFYNYSGTYDYYRVYKQDRYKRKWLILAEEPESNVLKTPVFKVQSEP